MQRRTNSNDAKQWKNKKAKKNGQQNQQNDEDQQLEELQKQHDKKVSNSNYISDLKNSTTDASGKKYVNDRIRKRDKIIKEKMKDGYSRDVAEKLWYKETKNHL